MSDKSFKQSPDVAGVTAHDQLSESREGVSIWVWLLFSLLVLLALAVIFVLPRMVEQYELPFAQRAESPAPGSVVGSAPVVNPVSPFDEAQRARQRREAQDVLSSLLTHQRTLDDLGVEHWAAESYERAVEAARAGDTHYRSGEFAQALEAYREGERLLGGLVEEVPARFEASMEAGQIALSEPAPLRAEEQYQLALMLDPDSEEAARGLERALSLEEVESLVNAAERLQRERQLSRAEERLQEALELDPEHERAGRLLARNEELRIEADFTHTMSRGFSLLQNNEPDRAIEAFQRALDIRPDAEQAREAIRNTRAQLTNAAIAQYRSQALVYEEEERWEAAVNEYRAALNLDSNLVFASEGLDYAERRLQLDRLLEEALANPRRLGQQEVFDYTMEVYRTGRDLDERGPRLARQLDALEDLLVEAREPVSVSLRSDNRTRVTIYQVGELGQFDNTRLDLRPGRYVAVGTRPGYRDVRTEFEVGFGSDPGTVTVICEEPVSGRSG